MGQIQHLGMNIQGMNNNSPMEEANSTNRKRKRKNTMQLKILKAEYQKNKEWSKELITKISEMTGLTESQIYKWNWDQKKKEEDEAQNGSSKCDINAKHSTQKIQMQRRLSEKENLDIDISNFKLVGIQTPNKNKLTILNPHQNKNMTFALKNHKQALKGSKKMRVIDCDDEQLGKRKPFG